MQDVKRRLLLGRELRGSWIVFLCHPPSSSPVRRAVGAAAPDRGGAAGVTVAKNLRGP